MGLLSQNKTYLMSVALCFFPIALCQEIYLNLVKMNTNQFCDVDDKEKHGDAGLVTRVVDA